MGIKVDSQNEGLNWSKITAKGHTGGGVEAEHLSPALSFKVHRKFVRVCWQGSIPSKQWPRPFGSAVLELPTRPKLSFVKQKLNPPHLVLRASPRLLGSNMCRQNADQEWICVIKLVEIVPLATLH